jgi:hypothetical protein
MATFPIEPAQSRYLWFIVPITALLIGVIVLLMVTVRGSRESRFEVSAEGLRLRGDLYGRTIPRARLQLDLARRVDLAAEPDLRPRWKTVGTGLPGYQAGWYRLRGGGKALLYLTDRTKAVYVPTADGYGLLLSPADPDGFLAALRGR